MSALRVVVHRPPMSMLGDLIRNYRTAAGMSQKALAIAIGVSQQSIAGWENGTTIPGWEWLTKIELAVGAPDGVLAAMVLPPVTATPKLGVVDAVTRDERLSEEAKDTLLRLYRLLAETDGPRRRRK